MTLNFADDPTGAVALTPVAAEGLENWLDATDDRTRAWLRSTGFKAKPGETALLPGDDGALARVLVGLSQDEAMWDVGGLADKLPEGAYRLDDGAGLLAGETGHRALIGWALGGYAFERYKARERPAAVLCWPDGADRAAVERTARAVYLVRDLVNTPAADMGPEELAQAAADLAARHGGRCRAIVGDDLLAENLPAIHAVGHGSHREPRLIDLTWGDAEAPKLTLVGKGVCFDTGGLDIKPASAMKLMKKDMGGAAHALGLASMVMGAGLPVRLRVLVPAVENAVGPRAMRPLDVVPTRKGVSVEIGHTDAEGRVVLADALAVASEESPDLVCDFATLTGAARVALGPDVPALFANDDAWAEDILAAGREECDQLWRLPLWQGYRKQIDSRTADISNESQSPYGGAIAAALFLERFVGQGIAWSHVDLMAWNTASRPGRPEGGEAMGLRAFARALGRRFGGSPQ